VVNGRVIYRQLKERRREFNLGREGHVSWVLKDEWGLAKRGKTHGLFHV